jgi:predicted nucleic acid-binding protein
VTIFVDANVLVYARDAGQPDKQRQAGDWVERLWESTQGRLSSQVLNEYYVTVTRKLAPGMPVDDARADVEDLMAWRPIPIGSNLVRHAWAIEDAFGFSFWDALIVAAAGAAGCRHLLTEDLQDNQDLDGIRVVNPFTHDPADFLD